MKRADRALKLFAAFVLVVFVACAVHFVMKFIRCVLSVAPVSAVESYEPVQVFIFGSSGDSVSASVSVLNADGGVLAQIERSWNSAGISIDFITVSFASRTLSFPERVYANRMMSVSTRSGVSLPRYYMRGGSCQLFASAYRPLPEKEQRARDFLADFALSPAAHLFRSFIRVQTVNLSYCVPGRAYSIKAEPNGNLFLYPVTY